MKLAAINISVAHVSGENRTGNRDFYGKERFDHEKISRVSNLLCKAARLSRGEFSARDHFAKTSFILEHDVESQLQTDRRSCCESIS